MTRCNPYGAENPGGMPLPFGGLLQQPVNQISFCPNDAVHRFRWVCEHGHQGPIVPLCQQHYDEFTGSRDAAWNMRRDVRSCPRCASLAPECDNPEHRAMYRGRPGACGCKQHKCKVELKAVS
jgi:hypothetical protein